MTCAVAGSGCTRIGPMAPRSTCRSLALPVGALLAAVLVGGCGGGPPTDRVAVGAAPTVSASSDPTVVPAAEAAASTVDGLDAAQLREAVEAPEPAGRARASGPVAQPVRLASGTTVWRVRIPGRFAVRSARVVVSVGGRQLGEGVPGSHLQSLVVVTRDPRGIVDGAPVTYRWAGGPTVGAGRLVVVR